MDVKSCIRKIVPREPGNCDIHLTWEHGYVSPLALARAALGGVGTPFEPHEFAMTRARPGG